MQSISRQQNNSDSKIESYVVKSRKHCGKRRKCWLPAFSPSPTMFSKAFFSRGVNKSSKLSQDTPVSPQVVKLGHAPDKI